MSKIALQTYTIRKYINNEKGLRDSLKKVKDIGYTNLQFTKPSYLTIEEQADLAKEYGLKIDSVYHPINEIENNLDTVCRNAEIIGTNVIRTSEIPNELGVSADGYHRFAETLNRWGRVLKNRGFLLVNHFHAFEFVTFGHNIRGSDIIIDNTDPDCVYFMPDVYWLTAAGVEVSRYLMRFKGRAFYLHVKDYAIKQLQGKIESVPNYFAPVGTGNIDWPHVMASAKEVGIEEFVVEQDESDGNIFEDIAISYINLSSLIEEYYHM